MFGKDKKENSNEKVLYEGQPNIIVYSKGILIAMVLLGFLFVLYSTGIQYIGNMQVYLIESSKTPMTRYFAIAVFILIMVVIAYIIIKILVWTSIKYTITENRVIVEKGIILSNRNSMPFNTIQDVGRSQSILGKLFSVGSITLYSAYDGKDLELKDISSPKKVEDLIFENMRGTHLRSPNLYGDDYANGPNYGRNQGSYGTNYNRANDSFSNNDFSPITPNSNEKTHYNRMEDLDDLELVDVKERKRNLREIRRKARDSRNNYNQSNNRANDYNRQGNYNNLNYDSYDGYDNHDAYGYDDFDDNGYDNRPNYQGNSSNNYQGKSRNQYENRQRNNYQGNSRNSYQGNSRNNYQGKSRNQYDKRERNNYQGDSRNGYQSRSRNDYQGDSRNQYPNRQRDDYQGDFRGYPQENQHNPGSIQESYRRNPNKYFAKNYEKFHQDNLEKNQEMERNSLVNDLNPLNSSKKPKNYDDFDVGYVSDEEFDSTINKAMNNIDDNLRFKPYSNESRHNQDSQANAMRNRDLDGMSNHSNARYSANDDFDYNYGYSNDGVLINQDSNRSRRENSQRFDSRRDAPVYQDYGSNHNSNYNSNHNNYNSNYVNNQRHDDYDDRYYHDDLSQSNYDYDDRNYGQSNKEPVRLNKQSSRDNSNYRSKLSRNKNNSKNNNKNNKMNRNKNRDRNNNYNNQNYSNSYNQRENSSNNDESNKDSTKGSDDLFAKHSRKFKRS